MFKTLAFSSALSIIRPCRALLRKVGCTGLLFVPLYIASGAEHDWSTGTVLDSTASRDLLETGTSSSSSTQANGTSSTHATIYREGLGHPTVDATTEASGQSNTSGAMLIHRTVFWDKQIVLEGGGYVYTLDDLTLKAAGNPLHGALGRAIANRKHGCRVVVGDDVKYLQNNGKILILDADGKECKLDIVRQERATHGQVPDNRK